jgi:hypothetical protein
LPSLAENIVESRTVPAGLLPAAQAVANQLARDTHMWNNLPEQDGRPQVLHAYQYEQLDDGSVLAFYAIDQDMDGGHPVIRLKAFPTLEQASAWMPRDEYAGWRHTTPVTAPTGDSDYTIGSGQ